MNGKNITIDELAAMVQEGFANTASKLDMESGFKSVNERLDRLEKQNQRMDNLEQRMKRIEDALVIK